MKADLREGISPSHRNLPASEGADEIGRGSHSRFVVGAEKLRGKVAPKAEMARARSGADKRMGVDLSN